MVPTIPTFLHVFLAGGGEGAATFNFWQVKCGRPGWMYNPLSSQSYILGTEAVSIEH